MQPSRRQFLAAAATTGAAALFSGAGLSSQDRAAGRRIDVHNHFGSPLWLQTLAPKEKNPTPPYPVWFALDTFKGFSAEKCIEDMDRGGVETSIVSNASVGVWFGDLEETRRLARDVNEWAAANLVSKHKGRFGLFAQLPLPDVDASLREIEYAFDTLKADGIGLSTSFSGKWLGDKSFAPVMDELNRRKAVVYTHPIDPSCCQNLIPNIQATTIEYNTDTSRTIMSLVVSGTAQRCPDLRFIFSHGGGTIVGLAGRILGGQSNPQALANPVDPNSRLGQLRRFYYDTAASANPINMTGLRMMMGLSQVLYGSDYFGQTTGNVRANMTQNLEKNAGLNADELQMINRENALRLFPKFRT